MNGCTIRPYKAGEASYVSYLQMRFYESVFGFNESFEHYILAAMAQFTASPDAGKLWVALDGDKLIGSIAIVKAEQNSAQLRWYFVEEQYHGKGIGTKLMETSLEYCKEQGFALVFLWTADLLDGARRMYERYGFKPTARKSNSQWSPIALTEERWDLPLIIF